MLFDVRGTKMIEINLIKGDNNIEVSLQKFSTGIYYYKVYANNSIIKTDKVVIIH
jgi:hypothetical protein